MLIPFKRSSLQGREVDDIHQTVDAGQVAGDQMFSHKCQELVEKVLGVRKALVTTACTRALEMAALLLDLEPGAKVIALAQFARLGKH